MIPPRVAIVGYGKNARDRHYPVWRRLEAEGLAKVTVVSETTRLGCDRAASDFPGAAVLRLDGRELLDGGPAVDIVDICTPGHLHAELVLTALERGLDILVEKPLCHSTADADAIIARIGTCSVNVCQTLRLSAPVGLFKEAVRRGHIGRPNRVQVTHHARHVLSEAEWVTLHRRDGILFENAIHFVDLVHYLLDSDQALTLDAARVHETTHRRILTGFELFASDHHQRPVTIDFAQDSLLHSALESRVYVCGSGADAELRFYPDGFRLLSGVLDPVHDLKADATRLIAALKKQARLGDAPPPHEVLARDLIACRGTGASCLIPPQSVRPTIATLERLGNAWAAATPPPCSEPTVTYMLESIMQPPMPGLSGSA